MYFLVDERNKAVCAYIYGARTGNRVNEEVLNQRFACFIKMGIFT
jgi:hypothetical protein